MSTKRERREQKRRRQKQRRKAQSYVDSFRSRTDVMKIFTIEATSETVIIRRDKPEIRLIARQDPSVPQTYIGIPTKELSLEEKLTMAHSDIIVWDRGDAIVLCVRPPHNEESAEKIGEISARYPDRDVELRLVRSEMWF